MTSKLWVQDYEYDDALRGFDRSLSELGLDYIDLYLLHKPYGNYYAAWRALERLHKEGRIRAIGVTSFSNERLQDLFLHNEIKPAVNQIETHPFQQQQDANAFLKAEASFTRPGRLLQRDRKAFLSTRCSKTLRQLTAKALPLSFFVGSINAAWS